MTLDVIPPLYFLIRYQNSVDLEIYFKWNKILQFPVG
jgi:hypothetical protein